MTKPELDAKVAALTEFGAAAVKVIKKVAVVHSNNRHFCLVCYKTGRGRDLPPHTNKCLVRRLLKRFEELKK